TSLLILFFFNDTAPTEIYTLSLHDALPICTRTSPSTCCPSTLGCRTCPTTDRKSTRLNSSHPSISYAVFCLKKNKNINTIHHTIYVVLFCSKQRNIVDYC